MVLVKSRTDNVGDVKEVVDASVDWLLVRMNCLRVFNVFHFFMLFSLVVVVGLKYRLRKNGQDV